jgi:ATP phosphoribosyltransferase
VYSRASNRRSKWIVAVPEASPIQTVKDLEGKRIATEVVNITKQYLSDNGVSAEVEFSWGATEVKVPDLVDAIVDLTETGNSLRANKLRIVDTLLYTNTVLVANKAAWENPQKREKVENIALLLQSALEATSKVGLKLNIERAKLDMVLEQLPALRNPTVNRLTDEAWVAIDTILDEKVVREIIPALKAHGAEGIVEYPLNKVVY